MSPKPKIGIITSFMPPHLGGLEVLAENLFHAYREAGCEVRWVASREPATTPSFNDGRIRVSCCNWSERWLGVPWPVWGPQGWRQISQVVHWADILHIHDCLYMGNIIAAVLARKAHKPCILSQHIGFITYRSRILNAIENLAYRTVGRAVIRLVSHVIFCTPPVEEFIREFLGISPNNATIIPYGIDIERYHPPTSEERALARQSLGLQNGPKVVLFVGRLVEKKGVDLFLEVVRGRPDLHFLMVGDGPLRPPVLENLTWFPYIFQDRMQLVYQAADVFLLPSHGEGFPVAVHEALATGLPVLVSKGEPFTAILAQGKAGLPVERLAASFSEALTQVFEIPGLAVSLGKNGRELVAQKWSTQLMGNRYLRVIGSLTRKE
ncbi:MAG: glycosyltransferase family 4 protein [Desulfobaccales bacterium]